MPESFSENPRRQMPEVFMENPRRQLPEVFTENPRRQVAEAASAAAPAPEPQRSPASEDAAEPGPAAATPAQEEQPSAEGEKEAKASPRDAEEAPPAQAGGPAPQKEEEAEEAQPKEEAESAACKDAALEASQVEEPAAPEEEEEEPEEPAPADASSSAPSAAAAPAAEAVERPRIGGWERAFRHDDELLRACGLWCKKVEADGACLFRAFSDQLEGDGGSGHLKYRSQCVTFLEANKGDFSPFVEEPFKGYLDKLREPSAWGGHVEAQALSLALGVNALIHVPAQASSADEVPSQSIEVINFDEDARCVQLCFHPKYHAGPHYNSVRCAGDKGDGVPASTNIAKLRTLMTEALQRRKQSKSSLGPGS